MLGNKSKNCLVRELEGFVSSDLIAKVKDVIEGLGGSHGLKKVLKDQEYMKVARIPGQSGDKRSLKDVDSAWKSSQCVWSFVNRLTSRRN